jgi:Protein of unknown function (DUF2934)
MWFVEQFNSFINLGICKEYPNMARSKSIPGSKSDRSRDQAIANRPAALPDGKTAAETAPTKINAEPRKFELRKTEPRANVVPISVEEEIRRRAYELYEQRGQSSGHEKDDWLVAEQEVMQRYHQQSA